MSRRQRPEDQIQRAVFDHLRALAQLERWGLLGGRASGWCHD
jgi:hypothetical protein